MKEESTPSRQADGDGKPLHDRLMQVSRLATIGEMAAGVAHELNQPLTAIATYAQACTRLLDRGEPSLGDVRDAMTQIASQAIRAGDIIRRLRSLVRNDETALRSRDLNALIGELKELMETDARVHAVRLRIELAEGLPPVCVDGVQIQHVLLNLLRNSLEAMDGIGPERREIAIRTTLSSDRSVELSVADAGCGIDPKVADRIFDPFFTTKAAGTGLGLSISATIMRAHGGSLTYRPGGPVGACFIARLPAI